MCCNKIPDWLTDANAKACTLLFDRSNVPVLLSISHQKYAPPETGLGLARNYIDKLTVFQWVLIVLLLLKICFVLL